MAYLLLQLIEDKTFGLKNKNKSKSVQVNMICYLHMYNMCVYLHEAEEYPLEARLHNGNPFDHPQNSRSEDRLRSSMYDFDPSIILCRQLDGLKLQRSFVVVAHQNPAMDVFLGQGIVGGGGAQKDLKKYACTMWAYTV